MHCARLWAFSGEPYRISPHFHIEYIPEQSFSDRSDLPSGGHLAVSGDIVGYHNQEGEYLLNTLQFTGQPPTAKNDPAPNVNSARWKNHEIEEGNRK